MEMPADRTSVACITLHNNQHVIIDVFVSLCLFTLPLGNDVIEQGFGPPKNYGMAPLKMLFTAVCGQYVSSLGRPTALGSKKTRGRRRMIGSRQEISYID